MKALLLLFTIVLLFSVSPAQTYKDGWAIGASLSSPRMFGDVYSEALDFGGNTVLQMDIDESNSLRLRVDYLLFTSKKGMDAKNPSTDAISVGIDYLIGLRICSPIQIYGGFGGKLLSYTVKKAIAPLSNKTITGEIAVSFYFGAKYAVSSEFDITTEASFNQVSTDRFDGKYGQSGGLFGGTLDSYLTGGIGWLYYFSRGEQTNYCDLPGGVATVKTPEKEGITIEQVEEVVKKYVAIAPQEKTEKIDYSIVEEIVKKHAVQIPASSTYEARNNWVLVGINFDEGKSSFRPEAHAILLNAAQVLLSSPDMRIEIQGHTNNVGSTESNKKLSQARAEAVKLYLVAKGVDSSRLTAIGYGDTLPVVDNATPEGKELNRRIEFKILK
ncbi:MAG: OmpA family protein [Ignavibacteriales bacterium]|nr:OmpA family protein [Ignavibacteriales bacterium]